jgi:alpha-glucosidase
MKYLIPFTVILFVLSFSSVAKQSAPSGKLIRSGNTIDLSVAGYACRIEICTPSMIRIRLAGRDGFAKDEPYMVNRYNWDPIPFTLREKRSILQIETSDLVVKIDKKRFSAAFYSPEGIPINRDVVSDSLENMVEAPGCVKELQPGEHFFGFGERMDFMDQLGKRLTLDVGRGTARDHETGAYNILEANYCPVPFFMSTRGYGIFFHNANPTTWDMGNSSPVTYSFSAPGGELDYYFIYGPTFRKIIEQYTSLTGRSPLLTEAAMGLHVGTYSGGTWGFENLTSQYYVVALAKKLRESGIPADILHLDSTWRIFGKVNGKGGTSFEWRQPGFPDPKSMFDSLYALNFQMVGLHIRPRIDNGNLHDFLSEAKKLGFTYPENGKPGDFPDFFDSKSVDWWWDNCLKPLADIGCRFVKTDEGSAFGRVGNELTDKTGPEGREIAALHNLFPIVYARAPFLKFQEYNKMRGMEHTREGYAGIQRYPFIFAGDWPSLWQYFKPVIRAGLNIGLSGVPAWAHCMGGFEQVADPELYIRWCQFGMFSPIAHLFGMEHPNYKEPWNYGAEARTIFTKYDRMRYRLIPYIYSAFYDAYLTGAPVMRALVFEYPADVNTYSVDDQYLFGDNLLVCPVTEKGARSRVLYLPEGKWIDYWTGQVYNGKKTIISLSPLDRIPLFVRAGAIIPMQPDMNYFSEKPADPITLDVYPSGGSAARLYEDNGRTLDYQKGQFAITMVNCREEKGNIQLVIGPATGEYPLNARNYILQFHTGSKPASVTVNEEQVRESSATGNEGTWKFDQQRGILELMVPKKADATLKIDIRR